MDFRDGLSAELPAPRDDEPGSLRDDILDELADHLACSYRRELLRGADAATASKRVLERFGDPAALARRLWFDAMKGKIMSQRILMACCIVLTVISLSLAFMMWSQVEHARRLAAEAERRMAMQMQESAKLQQRLLEEMQAVTSSAGSTRTPDWIPVSFKLTQETPDGPPATGFHASLGRGNQGATKEGAIQRKSDDKGMIDFGVVQPGDWEFRLYNDAWQSSGTINVLPGTTITKAIICPRSSPEQAPISVSVDWPPDLAESGLGVVASFSQNEFTYQSPLQWSPSYGISGPGWVSFLCMTRPDEPGAKRVVAIDFHKSSFWLLQGGNPKSSPSSPVPDDKGFKTGRVYLDLPWLGSSAEINPVVAIPGTYQIRQLSVVRPRKELREGFRGERCELLVSTFAWRTQNVEYRSEPPLPPEEEALEAPSKTYVSNPLDVSFHVAAHSYWIKPTTFEVKKDQPILWTVRLPEELVKAVREKLKTGMKH